MNKKIIIIVVIIVVFIGIFTAVKISKDEGNAQTVYSNKTEEVKNTENEIANEVNNETNNNIENEAVNNVIDEEKNENEETDTNKETQNAESNEAKAKRIAKNDWGEDDTIYYSYDGTDSNGDYIICVRDKSTTKALCWYHVNVEAETFEVKY